MDATQRKKLIDDLIDLKKKRFDTDLSPKNQKWFVGKLVDDLQAAGKPDAEITSSVDSLVTKAKAIALAEGDFALALTAGDNTRFTPRVVKDMCRHRVEILYGAIAYDPELAEPTNLAYLLFLAKRRFRGVCRMYFWVNKNWQGYFRYPDDCPADENWRINEDAKTYWQEAMPRMYSNYSPWYLKPAGVADPVQALESLFTRKTNPCKGNLFDCETTTSMIFMDTLREAKDPDQFLKKLASVSERYLLIHGFETDGLINTWMADTTAKGLIQSTAVGAGKITTVPVPAGDLQVGDQCYIFNHPLYKTFRPNGSWTGEYALVYATGDRGYETKSGYTFGGHGKEGTLFKFYQDFLDTLVSDLVAVRQLVRAHLAFLRGGAPAIAPGTVTEVEHPIAVGGAPATAYRLLQYDKNVQAKDFSKVPTKTKKKPVKAAPSFVVIQSKSQNTFYFELVATPGRTTPLLTNLRRTNAAIVAAGTLTHPIKISRRPLAGGETPSQVYALDQWGVSYVKKSTNVEEFWPVSRDLLHSDLFDKPFALFDPDRAELEVRKPKVDFTTGAAGHQAYLAANGAL